MRYVLIAISLLCAACSLLDGYDPCPSNPTPTPGPGAPPGPEDPTPPGDYADRYRKLSDGTVCVCGPYEIGCHDTPEGADASKMCSYGPEGKICDDYVSPAPPSYAVPDADELSGSARKWTCTMGKYNRDSKRLVERFARSESASSRGAAEDQARSWADRKNLTDKVYWWALIDDGCEPTAGDAAE